MLQVRFETEVGRQPLLTDIPKVMARRISPVVAWALLAAGVLATASAWRDRQPGTSSDFSILYWSAEHTSPEMFVAPPGYRGNRNPPLLQLILRPLTAFPLPIAAAIFRTLSIASLCACIWWLARASDERWTAADYGALLAWAPMASVIALNQLTWILWPLLLWAWWCWRQDRWSAGSVGYGLALGLKPFLGVFLLWLLLTRRWRAALVSTGVAALSFAIGVMAYGIDVSVAWIQALGNITWTAGPMNASLHAILARATTSSPASSSPIVAIPQFAAPLAIGGSLVIVIVTLLRTRRQHIDQSWLPLMASAFLASPLGWLYYIWWVLPGTRPSRLLFESPLLWVPWAVMSMLQPAGWVTLTLGSVYFWGLFGLWLNRMRFDWKESPPTNRGLVSEVSR
jgi:alpha-1,2-mannosyltransferase